MLFSELPYLCRRICAAVSSPCCFPHPAVFSILHVRISPSLPSRFPIYRAISHLPCHSHLPNVRSFLTFSTHLPKVRRSRTASKTTCSLISPSTVPFPPSEGGQVPHIFYSPYLPKVRRSRTASKTTCSLISPPTVPFPPSEGGLFPYIFYSPSEGVQKPYRPENRL